MTLYGEHITRALRCGHTCFSNVASILLRIPPPTLCSYTVPSVAALQQHKNVLVSHLSSFPFIDYPPAVVKLSQLKCNTAPLTAQPDLHTAHVAPQRDTDK